MTDTTKTNKSNWLDQITPSLLGRIGSAPANMGADYAQTGSICTSRHSGSEPPDSAITVISRIR
jgi:hypothetical protein